MLGTFLKMGILLLNCTAQSKPNLERAFLSITTPPTTTCTRKTIWCHISKTKVIPIANCTSPDQQDKTWLPRPPTRWKLPWKWSSYHNEILIHASVLPGYALPGPACYDWICWSIYLLYLSRSMFNNSCPRNPTRNNIIAGFLGHYFWSILLIFVIATLTLVSFSLFRLRDLICSIRILNRN